MIPASPVVHSTRVSLSIGVHASEYSCPVVGLYASTASLLACANAALTFRANAQLAWAFAKISSPQLVIEWCEVLEACRVGDGAAAGAVLLLVASVSVSDCAQPPSASASPAAARRRGTIRTELYAKAKMSRKPLVSAGRAETSSDQADRNLSTPWVCSRGRNRPPVGARGRNSREVVGGAGGATENDAGDLVGRVDVVGEEVGAGAAEQVDAAVAVAGDEGRKVAGRFLCEDGEPVIVEDDPEFDPADRADQDAR